MAFCVNQYLNAPVCLCVATVFRVDLFCSGKVDGEAVLTIQLNVTIQTNNYTVLNFKRRKMCYKSESSEALPLFSGVGVPCELLISNCLPRLQESTPTPPSPSLPPLSMTAYRVLTVSIINTTSPRHHHERGRDLSAQTKCVFVITFHRRCG